MSDYGIGRWDDIRPEERQGTGEKGLSFEPDGSSPVAEPVEGNALVVGPLGGAKDAGYPPVLDEGSVASPAAPIADGEVVIGGPNGGVVGSGVPIEDLTSDFTGDSGSGGVHGMVPAPAAGDNAAGKFLAAGGGWAVPSGTSAGLWSPQLVAVPSTGWSWDNQSDASIVSGGGIEYITNATDLTLNFRHRAAPATPYTVTALFAKNFQATLGDMRMMLIFRQSTTGKIIGFVFGLQGGAVTPYIGVSKWTDSSNWSADYLFSANAAPDYWRFLYPSLVWLRMADDGTDLSFWYSLDGINFTQLDQNRARGDFMTLSGGVTGPDQIGFGVGSTGASRKLHSLSVMSWEIG